LEDTQQRRVQPVLPSLIAPGLTVCTTDPTRDMAAGGHGGHLFFLKPLLHSYLLLSL
jgi:hypothetical protein